MSTEANTAAGPVRTIALIPKPLHELVRVEVNDQPGNGGANHDYTIVVTNKDVRAKDPTQPTPTDSPWGVSTTRLRFQNGPVNEVGANGISDEALLAILIDRAKGFCSGPFASREGSLALTHLQEAEHWLRARTQDRTDRGVEGYQKA